MAGVAIVTGQVPGVSTAAALRLAEYGTDVALLVPTEAASGDTAARIAALGRNCAVIGTDFADQESARSSVARVCALLGDPTVLVNTVRSESPYSAVPGPDPDWFSTASAGLRSAFLTSRAVLDVMVVNGGGRIINVIDGNGHANSTVRCGLEGFTRTVTLELRPLGITANLVVPAGPQPAIIPGLGADRAANGYPAQAADVVRLLAEERAVSVTGQVIHAG